jgi:hypothetical protein
MSNAAALKPKEVSKFSNWRKVMAAKRNGLLKRLGWMVGLIAMLLVALNASALDLPALKYGKLKRDPETTDIFQRNKVLPNHTYYISGRGNIPYAIIGLQNNYKLRLGLWKEVNLTTPLLRRWISQMDIVYGYPPYGSKILDNNGNQIGIWYSSKQWTTVIIEENNQVAILAPEAPGFRGGK